MTRSKVAKEETTRVVRAHTSEVVHTPLVPNYIRTVGGRAIPIAALTDDVLEQIGRNWTALLLRKAANRRAAR